MKIKEMIRQADNPSAGIMPLPPPHLLKPNVPPQTHHPGGVCCCSLFMSPPTPSISRCMLCVPFMWSILMSFWQHHYVQDKVFVGISDAPEEFMLLDKLQGPGVSCRVDQVAARSRKLSSWLQGSGSPSTPIFLTDWNGCWMVVMGSVGVCVGGMKIGTFFFHCFCLWQKYLYFTGINTCRSQIFAWDSKIQFWSCITAVK